MAYGKVGVQSLSDGSSGPLRLDTDGALVVMPSGGKYTAATLAGRMCFSYCAARATSVPATAQIGNIVWNPPGSGVNLVFGAWSAQIQVTSATTLGVTFGYTAQAITPTTVTVADAYGSTLLNAGSPGNCNAKAYAIGTLLVAPTPVMNLFHNTAAINTVGVDQVHGDFEGLFVCAPGYAVALSAITAAVTAAGMTSTLTWEEKPV